MFTWIKRAMAWVARARAQELDRPALREQLRAALPGQVVPVMAAEQPALAQRSRPRPQQPHKVSKAKQRKVRKSAKARPHHK